MRPGPAARQSGAYAALTVIVGLGACLIGVVCTGPTMIEPLGAWTALSVGSGAVIVALAGLWWLERRRDRTPR